MTLGERDAALERRLLAMERRLLAMESRMGHVEISVEQNKTLANSIKLDTSEMVTLFKASRVGASIVKWCATVGGGAIVAYAAFKGLRT